MLSPLNFGYIGDHFWYFEYFFSGILVYHYPPPPPPDYSSKKRKLRTQAHAKMNSLVSLFVCFVSRSKKVGVTARTLSYK